MKKKAQPLPSVTPQDRQRYAQARARGDLEWMTIQDVARYLGTGVDIVYDAIAAGGLKHVKLGHRTIRLRRAWVDAWMDERANANGYVNPPRARRP